MSNVVPLFRTAPSKQSKPDITNVVSCMTDWAEANGVDIYDAAFSIRCTDIVTLLQIMVQESPKVKVA